jgi:hypothetical protein
MCNKQNISEFIQKLQKIAESPQNSLEKEVALEALANGEDNVTLFFENLMNHGCISGMVGSLIYYRDTEIFFDQYYEDIIWLKTEYEEAIGQPMVIPHQIKNHLAWFAFEETARKLWEAE